MSQLIYEAKITPSVGGSPVIVSVPANDPFQAKRMIESMYGPVKTWWWSPALKR